MAMPVRIPDIGGPGARILMMKQMAREKMLELLRMMVLIRRFEIRMQENFKQRTRAGEAVD